MSTAIDNQARQRKFFAIAIALVILGLGIYRSFSLPETDTLWQVRAGVETLTTWQIPRIETWDWLVRGDDWLPNSWLWNVLVALCYQAGGLLGLAALNLILFMGLLGLAWLVLRQLRVNPVFQFLAVFMFAVVMVPWVTLRPQEIDYMLLLTFFSAVLATRDMAKPRRLWLLGAATLGITVAWMNFHLTATAALAFFPLGYLLLAREVAWRTWRQHVLPVVMIVALVAIGLFITPFGLEGILKTISVSGASRDVITEWRPLDFRTGIAPVTLLGLIVAGLLPLVYMLWRRHYLYALTVLALTITSFEVIRFTPYLIVFAVLTVAFLPPATRLIQHGGSYVVVACAILLLGAPLMVGSFVKPTTMLSVDPAAFDPIPTNSRVLTLPLAGGSMLLFRPDLSPSMDGRNDLFGETLYKQVVSYFYGKPPAQTLAWLDQQKVNAVYIKKIDPKTPLTGALRQAGWTEHDTALAIVFVRPGV